MSDFTIRSPFHTARRGREQTRRRLQLLPGGAQTATAPTTEGGHAGAGPDAAPSDAGQVAAGSRATLGVTMVVLVVILSLIGSVMILSASSVAAVDLGGSSFAVFYRQSAWLAAGLVVLLVSSRIDYHRWYSLVPVLVLGTLALLAAVLVPGLGVSANGAQRWIGFGSFQVQPAEPAKFAMIVYVAALVARERHRITDLRVVLRPVLVVLGLFAALLMLQPNLGTTTVLAAIVACMLVHSGMRLRVLAMIGGAGALLFTVFALSEQYRRERITAFLDPWADAADTGYQTIQSLIGVASGGLTGAGLGESRAKWGFLPEAHTDFVFAIIGEELGLIGSLAVVGVFAGMIVCSLRIASRASDMFGSMVAVGVAAWFSIQAFVNVGAVLGLLPITGVPLPFVSFGGSSLLTTMLAAGVLVNIAMQGSGPAHPVRGR